jgi:serine phosphatase RsbU (regulator of sigma subunit)
MLSYHNGIAQNTKTIDTTEKDNDIHINFNDDDTLNIVRDDYLDLDVPWKSKQGDDTLWATENFNDSDWKSQSYEEVLLNNTYSGVVWYRIHFTTDSTQANVPIALSVRQFGSAADIYIDGKFLNSFGKVGHDLKSEQAEFSVNPNPIAFVLSNKKDHLLAIRFSNFHREKSSKNSFNLGSMIVLTTKPLDKDIASIINLKQYFPMIFFSGIFLTLSVLHFIMYIFYRVKIANLFYSLYCMGFFFIAYFLYHMLTSSDYESITTLLRTLQYIAPLLVLPLVAMLHSIFYQKLLKIFWILLALYTLSLLCFFLDYKSSVIISITTGVVLFFISVIEIIRVILKSIKVGKDGALIFLMVIVLAPALTFAASFFEDISLLGNSSMKIHSGAVFLVSFILSLPFSMTIYLARDFARISNKLKIQLKEITDLSNRTIEQEQEKKRILENLNTELEQKVFERTQQVVFQKEEIQIKNKEITESLIYAKRIQSAILPDIKLIYKTLEQSFILYLPKDIVSGDFYGFAQKNNKVIIAAADCTGHGVAGAFMSMIGSSLLNQIINEKNITAPALILEELNQGIINALKQKESESNDGMDISICAFDLTEKTVQFAGANRPLWLIRNGELATYKPNKFPIGGLQVLHEESFTEQTIALQKGDTLYLFSDGFADQFGGENGKKLMTKKFKDALVTIQHLSMPEQNIFLTNLFEKWKGNNEQVDDVLVIGIRV